MGNKNYNEIITMPPRQDDRSSIILSKRDMSTPYMSAFYAAKAKKMQQATQTPPMPMAHSAAAPAYPRKNTYKRPEVYDDLESGNDIDKAKTKVKPIKIKREAIIIILTILVVAMIAVFVLSALKVMPEYTEFYRKNDIVGDGEIPPESNEDSATVPINNLDMALAFLKKFLPDKLTQDSVYYTDYMATVDDMAMLPKIMTFVVPASIMLSAIILLIFFVRLLVALFTRRRRSLYIFTTVLLLLLSLINIVAMFIVVAGTEFAKLKDFVALLPSETPLQIQLGIGAIAMVGLSLIAFIFSFFAFKPKKKIA